MKVTKRLLSVILSLCMLLTGFIFGVSAADSEDIVVVCADTTYEAEGEKVFTTVKDAINYIGQAGGTIYIKGDISFSNGNNGTPLNFEGDVENRGAVTLRGYGNVNTGGSVSFTNTNPGTAYIKGDIIFENLTVYGTSSEFPFAAIGHKMTFGEGLSTPSGKYLLGSRNDGGGSVSADIYSGSFGYVVPIFYNTGWGNKVTASSEYNIYGGSVSKLFLGVRNLSGENRIWQINGDVVANVYGGTVTSAYIGHENHGAVLGDAYLNIYGGNVSYVGFSTNSATNTALSGNTVISIYSKGKDGSTFTKAIAIKQDSKVPEKTDSSKKFITIINNSEEGVHSFDSSLSGDYVDYMLKVENGNAVPVFERTNENDPSTSTFKGFRFNADGGSEYYFPVINGKRLKPSADGIYDLSDYEGDGEITVTLREFLTPVVTTESYTPAEGEKIFPTVSSAIDYLGLPGGTIYVKGDISFANNNGTPLNFEGTTDERGAVTISGYGNSNAGGSVSFNYTNPGSAYIKGDIIFKNLTIYGTTSEYPFGAIGHKITFGEGLSTPSGKYLLGARDDNGGDHKMDIYSGTYQYVVPVFYNASWGLNNKKASSEYNIYGGTVSHLYTGSRNASSNISRVHMLNGDSIANIYGGTVKNVNVGHEYSGTLYGDSIINLYGGNITNIGFINTYEKDTQNLGNAVITVWSKGTDGSEPFAKAVSIKQGEYAPAKTDASKKRIAIINNANKGSHSFDSSLTAEYCDYMLKVNGGIAEAVFERTDANNPSTSILKGFRLTAEYEGAEPYIDGVKLVAGEDGLYNLDCEGDGETVIDFKHYGKHWVKYGATGEGTSPDDPAPSVAYVINNHIANTYSAGEEVTVYVLQDDGEELYNSTAYVTDDAGYSASPIGEKPTAHIVPWKTSTETVSSFDAKITVTSYEDGETDKNYLIYSDLLGDPVDLHLTGDVVFDNIILVSPKKNHQSIFTDGNDVTFTENCGLVGINAYYAENADTAWDGSFVASQGANAVMSVDGSNIVFGHAWEASTAGRQITIGAEGAVFNNDATVALLGKQTVKTPIYVANTTFKKNFNIISAGEKSVLKISHAANAKVEGAVQFIYSNSSATINNMDYLRTNLANLESLNPDGGMWILRAEPTEVSENGMYIDVTETAGTFKCTREGGVLLAQNTATLEHTVSENGFLTLDEGTYDVYFLSPDEGESFVNTKTYIVALEDTTVDLSAQEHRIFDGQIFLGWKNEKTNEVPASTATLKKGDVLTAQYDTFTYGENGDFRIYGVQMRLTDPTGVRFIIDRKDSVIEKLGGEDSVIESGAIVLPTELTHGKDMAYGESIYSNENLSLTTIPTNPLIKLGTPKAVPAEKIYSKYDGGVYYTAVLIGINEANYSTFYSVMGYIRYYDANGNEQIVYSDYAQSSLYKVALQAYGDTNRTYTEDQIAFLEDVIEYVEVTEPALYYETYIGENYEKATKIVCAIDGEGCTDPNHAMYKLSNKLNVREVNIDWDYSEDVADESNPVEIAHITDTHFNYNNNKDKNENEMSIAHQYETSAFYGEARTAVPAVRAMEYAQMCDKVVITGDIIHSLADGSLQVSDRLLFRYDTWVGARARTDENGNPLSKVVGTLGNHERYKHMIGVVPDDKHMNDNYPALQEYFPNDIVYHSEVMTTLDGKNPVMLVLLDDQRERYADEEIRDNLTVDLAKAREENIPVLIFQHVALYTGDSSVTASPSYYEDVTVPNMRLPGNPNSTELTKEIYNLITDNADIVAGVFCGHEHASVYNEIIGTGENGTGHVIPQNYLSSNQDNGGFVIKIVVK